MADDDFDGERVVGSSFIFEVDGVVIGRFTEVTGLQVEIAVETVEEGGQNGFAHQLPGRMTWPPIVLKRGVTQNDSLIKWFNKSSGEQFASGGNKVTRSSGAITLTGPSGKRLRTWSFDGAFPTKWSGPSLSSTSDEVPTEELTIVHNGFKVKDL